MEIGQRLQALRRARGLTQEQLAERAGLTRVTVSALERGENEPTGATIGKLVAGLKLASAGELIDAATNNPGQEQPTMSKLDAQGVLGVVPLPLFNAIPPDFAWGIDSPHCEGEFYVLRSYLKRPDSAVLQIHGGALWPDYLDGDFVLIDSVRRNPRSREVIIAKYAGRLGLFRFRREGRRTFLEFSRLDEDLTRRVEIVDRGELIVGGIVIALVWRDGSKTVT